MSLFSEIEKTIERGFRRWTERMFGPADSNELLLVHRAILEEIEGKVQVVARGRRVFPFARVVVTLVAAEAERRTLLQAAFGERLGEDVREALEGSECELPRGFSVEVRTAEAGACAPSRSSTPWNPRSEDGGGGATGRLVVVKGKTDRAEYPLERARTNIGRLPELTDADHRVVRRNDVVFEEGARRGQRHGVAQARAHSPGWRATTASATMAASSARASSATAARSKCRRAIGAARSCAPATRSISGARACDSSGRTPCGTFAGIVMSILVTLPRVESGASKSFSLPRTRTANWSLFMYCFATRATSALVTARMPSW